jgi:hypothetical protein
MVMVVLSLAPKTASRHPGEGVLGPAEFQLSFNGSCFV